jgi:hypothetical protein
VSPQDYLYHAIESFRHLFSRRSTFLLFAMVMLALLAAPELVGVTSLCRFWNLGELGYHRLLRLFRSEAWDLTALVQHWMAFVMRENRLTLVNGRAVMQGDHTQAVKDGGRMPGVVTLHANSETQSKPSFFRGQLFGVVGVLIGPLSSALCLPLMARLHLGHRHLRMISAVEDPETMATRVVEMALSMAVARTLPVYLVLDAFFSVGPVFTLANSVWSLEGRGPLVHILTRGKKSYVAYEEPPPREPGQRGRPPKYGPKVKLAEVFETHKDLFQRAEAVCYSEREEISFLALDLLWKPTGGKIRFIFAVTSRGPIVLMTSDLTLSPVLAVELYCARVRVESTINSLKHLVCAFVSHFWTKRLPRHSRRPGRNATLEGPAPEDVPTVAACWEAYERYAALACVALGLLQLIALKFGTEMWRSYHCYQRTPGYATPSEAVTRVALARLLAADFRRVACHALIAEIQDRLRDLLYTFSPPPERRIPPRAAAPPGPRPEGVRRKPQRHAVPLWEIISDTLLPGVSVRAGLGAAIAVIRRRVLGPHRQPIHMRKS